MHWSRQLTSTIETDKAMRSLAVARTLSVIVMHIPMTAELLRAAFALLLCDLAGLQA